MLTLSLIFAAATFGFVTAITPGPNNTILLATSVNHGFRKALPYLAGISFGLMGMITLVGLGLNLVFATVPVIYQAIKYLGFGYILYLAISLIRSGYQPIDKETKVIGFFQSVSLQFVNPKVWVVVPSFMAGYIPAGASFQITATLAAVFLISKIPGALAWAGFGQLLRNFLMDPKKRKAFNWVAGVLLVASMVPVLFLR
ncbi:LysE family translocator [Candidatus Aquiluna sp. UB-MaderosW2red]|uniref:LysE family translocator n=1 Tax=Candidatus Aquiluna sp. UB-MaderosW2red TaxID=1855377 RepID=UPI000875DBBF|nr:LysE family translocator [Candidatus Aquiluna sp. UB-MaderosW2red]SCX14474.1 Threonine/homoserine/homoserine lactone efflux protein [Candidatus Aquiluna sp. UB-MaderosW2red]